VDVDKTARRAQVKTRQPGKAHSNLNILDMEIKAMIIELGSVIKETKTSGSVVRDNLVNPPTHQG
jgi:hypothetical protein